MNETDPTNTHMKDSYILAAPLPKEFHETLNTFRRHVDEYYQGFLIPEVLPPHIPITAAMEGDVGTLCEGITGVLHLIPFRPCIHHDCILTEAEARDEKSIIQPVELSSARLDEFQRIRDLLYQIGICAKVEESNFSVTLATLAKPCAETSELFAEIANGPEFLWPSIFPLGSLVLYGITAGRYATCVDWPLCSDLHA